MDKRILLIGNNDGLPGVKVDLKNYKSYFKSDKGGQWLDSEIQEELNPRKDHLLLEIDKLKRADLDYLIVVFSGHGGQERETVLELNSYEEILYESRLHNIARRQLTIFDCCRAYAEPLLESLSDSRMLKNFSAYNIRQKYERRLLSASEQQVKLYACSIGEYANDTSQGGAYSKNLIKAGYADTSEFVYVGRSHMTACEKTIVEFPEQHPEAIQPRLLSSQQLIWGIS